MKTLYNLTQEQLTLLNEIEDKGGNIDQEMFDRLNANECELKYKFENYYYLIQHIEQDELVIEDQIFRLQTMKDSKHYLVKTLKQRMLDTMNTLDISEIKTEGLKIKVCNSPISCTINDIDKVPEKFKQTTKQIVVNKTALIKYYKDNNLLTNVYVSNQPELGVTFVQNKHLRFV